MKMKAKRIFAITLFVLFAFAAFALPSSAEYSHPDRMVDEGDLLTDSQEAALRSELDRLSLQYNCDIVIVTASSLNGLSAMEYADDYFDYNHYGLGSNNSGILMLVCLEERAYWFSTCGDAITMFSDKTIDYMRDLIPDYLTDGDYYGAFEKYIEMSDNVIGSYVNDGKIYTPPRKLSATHVLISIALGVGVAFIIMSIKKSKMKTVRMKQEADSYVRSGSMQLTDCRDTFLYSKVDRTRRETESSSGSSTHTSSSGESHGGGGGSF